MQAAGCAPCAALHPRRADAAGLRCPGLGRPALRQGARQERGQRLVVRAERSGGGGFFSGFVVGGVVFGALGFLFAPQISAALLSEDQRLKLPKFLEDDKETPVTKQDLADKIAQLNSAIDEVSAQMKAQDVAAAEEGAVPAAALPLPTA